MYTVHANSEPSHTRLSDSTHLSMKKISMITLTQFYIRSRQNPSPYLNIRSRLIYFMDDMMLLLLLSLDFDLCI